MREEHSSARAWTLTSAWSPTQSRAHSARPGRKQSSAGAIADAYVCQIPTRPRTTSSRNPVLSTRSDHSDEQNLHVSHSDGTLRSALLLLRGRRSRVFVCQLLEARSPSPRLTASSRSLTIAEDPILTSGSYRCPALHDLSSGPSARSVAGGLESPSDEDRRVVPQDDPATGRDRTVRRRCHAGRSQAGVDRSRPSQDRWVAAAQASRRRRRCHAV